MFEKKKFDLKCIKNCWKKIRHKDGFELRINEFKVFK